MEHIAESGARASRLAAPVLLDRLDSIRLSLGCDRLAVVRRLPGASTSGPLPLEVLGQVGAEGAILPPETELPLEFVHELLAQARAIEFTSEQAPPLWSTRLARWRLGWLAGWPLPSDRLPSVVFVAMRAIAREPGPVRREVARAGMEALARLLAPPQWLPLGRHARSGASRPPSDGPPMPGDANAPDDPEALVTILARVEREILVGALQAAEGNKSLAARKLRVSRQGLYRKLRRHGLLRRRARALDSEDPDD